MTSGRDRRVLPAALALLTGGSIAAVWAQLPLANGPQEWQWAYRSPGLAAAGLAVALAAAGLVLLAVLARSAARVGPVAAPEEEAAPETAAPVSEAVPGSVAVPATRPASDAVRMAVLLAAGTAFTFGLLAAQPGGFGRVLESLVSRHSFGFVWDAGLAPDRRTLLADYPAASQGLNQHSVTHPPGPLLAVRALDRLVSPLAPPIASIAPGEASGQEPGSASLAARAAWAIERARVRAANHSQPLPQHLPGAWTVVVLALLLPVSSALAAWPLHRLALACGLSRRAALLAAALWLLVPARSLFTPSLDQALPLLLLTAACLAAGRALWRAACAGLLLWCACFLSYGCLAALPLLCALIFATARSTSATSDSSPRSAARTTLASLAALIGLGMLLPWGALSLFTGYDPWHAFRAAIELHHKIAVEPRGYLTWLLFNPYDFALLLGPPVLLLAVLATVPRRPVLAALGWGFWAVMAALWLSGSVRGEVGRIWLPWMPFACLLAAGSAQRWSEGAGNGSTAWDLTTLLLTQAALALTLAANMIFVS
jgi:hypothetical protein